MHTIRMKTKAVKCDHIWGARCTSCGRKTNTCGREDISCKAQWALGVPLRIAVEGWRQIANIIFGHQRNHHLKMARTKKIKAFKKHKFGK